MLGRPIFIILSGMGLTFGKTDFFDFFCGQFLAILSLLGLPIQVNQIHNKNIINLSLVRDKRPFTYKNTLNTTTWQQIFL